MKDEIMGILVIFGILFISWTIFFFVQDIMINRDIKEIKANYEAELREQGLLPKKESRRSRTDIYIPVDRTGQANRQDSTAMFLKSAQDAFGSKEQGGLQTVDYGSQVDEYRQKVNAVKRAEAQKLQRQRAQQESLSGGANRSSRPQGGAAGSDGSTTRINKLRTFSL